MHLFLFWLFFVIATVVVVGSCLLIPRIDYFSHRRPPTASLYSPSAFHLIALYCALSHLESHRDITETACEKGDFEISDNWVQAIFIKKKKLNYGSESIGPSNITKTNRRCAPFKRCSSDNRLSSPVRWRWDLSPPPPLSHAACNRWVANRTVQRSVAGWRSIWRARAHGCHSATLFVKRYRGA